jgi:hypothetical protein
MALAHEIIPPLPEGDRQLILLALARLALARPGWNHYCGEIADRLDGRQMFDAFKASNSDIVKPENLLERTAASLHGEPEKP